MSNNLFSFEISTNSRPLLLTFFTDLENEQPSSFDRINIKFLHHGQVLSSRKSRKKKRKKENYMLLKNSLSVRSREIKKNE